MICLTSVNRFVNFFSLCSNMYISFCFSFIFLCSIFSIHKNRNVIKVFNLFGKLLLVYIKSFTNPYESKKKLILNSTREALFSYKKHIM